MNFHISTTKIFRLGIPPNVCPICEHKTLYNGWNGSDCDTCGADTSHDYLPDYIRHIREATKLSRKEIAEKFGVKPSTIKSYEWKQPSKKYYVWFKKFIKQFYKEK